jgi:hypothetical protein
MLDRLHFLVVYVGSAALTAFLAACMSSPRVAMYTCGTHDASGVEQCELAATLAAVSPETGYTSLGGLETGATNPVQVAAVTP